MDYESTAFFERLNGFLRIPNSWFVLLMADEGAKCADGGFYKAVHPSFWKFLLKLWHQTMWARKGKPAFSASLSLREFGIRPKDACLWANAIVAGGLFTVQKGTFSNRKASTYTYNTAADAIAWQGFYRGLMMAYESWRSVDRKWNRTRGGERMEQWAKLVRMNVENETEQLRRELQ